uniref:Uncharacterized protein n=1 Tax=Timema poppense TaxID=170557 RepID=A0A7R9HDW3_TIMPO|nr:unnamed protein product [Timema poppensis]
MAKRPSLCDHVGQNRTGPRKTKEIQTITRVWDAMDLSGSPKDIVYQWEQDIVWNTQGLWFKVVFFGKGQTNANQTLSGTFWVCGLISLLDGCSQVHIIPILLQHSVEGGTSTTSRYEVNDDHEVLAVRSAAALARRKYFIYLSILANIVKFFLRRAKPIRIKLCLEHSGFAVSSDSL